MKRFLLIALALRGLILSASDTIDLATVSVIADAAHSKERDELVKHLVLIAGKTPDGSGKTRIVVGAAPEGAQTAECSSYGRRVGDTVFLWGHDVPSERVQTRRCGTMHAVSGFLETVLGVRWVFPGDDGIVFTPRERVVVPDGWRWEFSPPIDATEIGSTRVFREMKANNPYLPVAMRETEAEVAKRMGDRSRWMRRMRHQTRFRPPFGHAFIKWSGRFLATHPEYFAMQEDGARCRKPSRRNELCVSNEEVVDRIIADWKAEGKPKYLNVCPNDTVRYCRCPECRKLDRPLTPDEPFGMHVTDRYVNFWNRIARKAVAERPDVMIDTYAYSGYREPPRFERIAFPDNFIFGMVPSQEDDNAAQIAAWKKVGMKRFFLRPNYLHYRGVIPRGYERHFHRNFLLNFREGMVGCFYDALARGGVTDFETYVVARVAADPKLSFETLEEEFLSQFGPAKETMRRYFRRVRERGERSLAEIRSRPPKTRERRLDDSQLWTTVVSANPVDELEKDAAIVAEALALSGLSPVERRRVARHDRIVRNAVATRRFIGAKGTVPRKEFVAMAYDLIDLRIRLKPEHPDAWGRVFRGFPLEVKWWRSIIPELRRKYPEMELED